MNLFSSTGFDLSGDYVIATGCIQVFTPLSKRGVLNMVNVTDPANSQSIFWDGVYLSWSIALGVPPPNVPYLRGEPRETALWKAWGHPLKGPLSSTKFSQAEKA